MLLALETVSVRLLTAVPAPSLVTRPSGWKYSAPEGDNAKVAAPVLAVNAAWPSGPA